MFVAAFQSGFQTWPVFNPQSQDSAYPAGRHSFSIPRKQPSRTMALQFFTSIAPQAPWIPISSATASYPLRPHSSPHAPPSTSPNSPSKPVASHAPSSDVHIENRNRRADSSASSSPLPVCTPPSSNKNCPCLRHTRESSHEASGQASPSSFECCSSNRTRGPAYTKRRCDQSSPFAYPIAASDNHRLRSVRRRRPKFQSAALTGYGSPAHFPFR